MLKRYSKILLVILISLIFFTGLYNLDNKYDYDALQASNGFLIISQNDLEKHPVRFLSNSWSFYPDVLLSPDDFKNGDPDLYMKNVNIGENTTFNPYGKGTYILRINLPHKATYGIDIPEIFSAYRVYIDNEEFLSLGTPEKDTYTAKTANRMLTFERSGTITIMIAVSNYSHFYSGMVYPPAFGTPVGLNYTRAIHLGVNLIAITSMLIVALLSLYFGIVQKQKNNLLYTLLCFASISFISYPIVHSIFVTNIFPWYTLEVLSGYLVMLLVVILHNRFCHINKKIRFISTSIITVFCMIVFIYCLNSANLTNNMIQLFSNFVFLFKIIIASYLLITSYMTLKNNFEYKKILFYSDIFYAGACICDRIYPNYEPIYGFRFIEWGCIVLVFSIGFVLWKNIIEAYAYNLSFIEEHRQITRQLALQMEYIDQIKEAVDEKRRLIHDFRQHLRVIDNMAQKTNQTMISEYLNNTYEFIDNSKTTEIFICNNAAVDAILQYYFAVCKKQKIKLDIKLSIPEQLPLGDVELCSIFGNLLENAIEACQRQKSGKKFIYINSKEDHSMFYLIIENSYDGKVIKSGNKFLSFKKDANRIGIGLESVKKTLHNYQGTIDIYHGDNTFRVGITIPIR